MLLMMLEKKMPIDEIVFCDTGKEFEEIYCHIKDIEKYIDREITVLKPEKSFEYYLFEHKKKSSKNKSLGYGFPRMICNRWCTSLLKTDIFNSYIKKYGECRVYIGIAIDEKWRCKKDKIYPLVEWEKTEKECLNYCYAEGFNFYDYYKKFKRGSCWCCPQMSLPELYNLYFYYPHYWQKLREWEVKTYNNFRKDYTIKQLEKKFKHEKWWHEHQISMYDGF